MDLADYAVLAQMAKEAGVLIRYAYNLLISVLVYSPCAYKQTQNLLVVAVINTLKGVGSVAGNMADHRPGLPP